MEINIEDVRIRLSRIRKEDIVFTRHAGFERALERDLSQETVRYYLLRPELLIRASKGRRDAILLYYKMSHQYELVVVAVFFDKMIKILTEYKNLYRPKRMVFK